MKSKKILIVTALIIAICTLSSCKLFKKDKCNTCPKWSKIENTDAKTKV